MSLDVTWWLTLNDPVLKFLHVWKDVQIGVPKTGAMRATIFLDIRENNLRGRKNAPQHDAGWKIFAFT